MQEQTSSTHRLASLLVGMDVGEWIAERRSHPYGPTWQTIALELAKATGDEVRVSRETVRQWHLDAVTDEAVA